MIGKIHLLFVASLLALAAQAIAQPLPRYTVIPLQPLAGAGHNAYALPTAMNDTGDAVGLDAILGANRKFITVRWGAAGHYHILGKQGDNFSYPQSINDAGQIIIEGNQVGDTDDAPLYLMNKDGNVTEVTHLPGGVLPSGMHTMGFIGGEAINNKGEIAFNADGPHGFPQTAYLYGNGKLTDLGHLSLLSFEASDAIVRVNALSGNGMAVGNSMIHRMGYPETYDAFVWKNGRMTDLGAPKGYATSSGTGVNDSGEVIGTMTTTAEGKENDPSISHGFLWRNGKFINLGALPGCANTNPTSINNKGQIVGDSFSEKTVYNLPGGQTGSTETGGSLGGGVFLWQDGKMINLQTLAPAHWELQKAIAINNQEEILCTGYYSGKFSIANSSGAFILKPIH